MPIDLIEPTVSAGLILASVLLFAWFYRRQRAELPVLVWDLPLVREEGQP